MVFESNFSTPRMIGEWGICRIAIPIFAVFAVRPCSSAVMPPHCGTRSQRCCCKCRHWNCVFTSSVFTCVNSLRPSGLGTSSCEGCDIVQSDHAPQAGVAQGIFDGELVRRRVGHQVELEEEQDKEVERRVRRDAQRTTHRCACMDDME